VAIVVELMIAGHTTAFEAGEPKAVASDRALLSQPRWPPARLLAFVPTTIRTGVEGRQVEAPLGLPIATVPR